MLDSGRIGPGRYPSGERRGTRRFVKSLAALLVTVSVFALASPKVHAYEERATIELGLAPALHLAPDLNPGFCLDFVTTWGVSDRWSLGGSARYAYTRSESARHMLIPAVEATWALDIVGWVPRASFGVGAAIPLESSPRPALDLLARIGVDRLLTRGLIGFDARVDVYGVGGPAGLGRVGISVGVRWGFVVDRF